MSEILRATTPTFIFNFPEGMYEGSKEILITFKQGNKIIFDKLKDDLVANDDPEIEGSHAIHLTQKEANMFDPSRALKIQVRFLAHDGEVCASIENIFSVQDVLNDKELK